MLKKIALIMVVFVLTCTLCGCDFFTADMAELLSPPSLSDDLKSISKAISKSVDGAYSFKYPQTGQYRSAVVQKDINGDNVEEAFAFYSTTDGDITTMNINVVCKNGEEWQSSGQLAIVAAGIHSVEFCDLDSDGISEILVGWQIYATSEMQLAVYSFKDNVLTQRMLKKYTHFATCDLDDNNANEILIIEMDTENAQNRALLYGFTNDGITQISQCELDSKVETFEHPIISELSTGKKAVYIDSVKGIGAITEILFFSDGVLSNPLFDIQTRETSLTLRSVSFKTNDFDGDGTLEIPVQLNVPSVSKNEVAEKLYLTNWCTFDGEKLTTKVTSMINVLDGYYYNLPESWVGNIAILKDTDNRIREIYEYDTEEMAIGSSLLYLRAINKKDWDSGVYDALNLVGLMSTEEIVIACRISKQAKDGGLTVEKIKSNLGVYSQAIYNQEGKS